MSDDSDPPIFYEYIEKKSDETHHMNEKTLTVIDDSSFPSSIKEIKSDNSSSSDDDSVVIITTIKTKKEEPPKPSKIIKLVDQEFHESQELSSSQKNENETDALNSPSSSFDITTFKIPSQREIAENRVPFTLTNSESSSEEENEENSIIRNEEISSSDSEDDNAELEHNEAEAALQDKLRELRKQYLDAVQKALEEFSVKGDVRKITSSSIDPPNYGDMTVEKLTEELAKYGFRYTNRASAVSKLTRIWGALNDKQNRASSAPKKYSDVSNPIDFIRLKSKFYEDILTYVPIPLVGLHREMTEYGVKCSLTKLRQTLSKEGVAFLEDSAV